MRGRCDLWLHIDGAYGGVAAMCQVPLRVRRLRSRDSFVVNPHKWLFVPFDLSVLYCRRMDLLRTAFSLTADYLKTSEAATVRT